MLAGRLENASASSNGVIGLEDQIVALRIPFVILRYGRLYGPGTGSDQPWGAAPVHVDAAAYAAVLTARTDAEGVFNIAESDGEVDTARAETRLGWTHGFRGWQVPTARNFSFRTASHSTREQCIFPLVAATSWARHPIGRRNLLLAAIVLAHKD